MRILLLAVLLSACSQPEVSPSADTTPKPSEAPPAAARAAATQVAAKVGEPAPDFDLPTIDGGRESLSKHKGKIVVLEWFNPQCPFVVQSHGSGALKGMAAANADVVWLAINSAAPGKQGHGTEPNETGRKTFGMSYPILFDEDGKVGLAYGATNTPHMYVIDEAGKLVYAGAIDDTRGGDVEEGTKVENHVAAALEAVKAKREVATKETKAWGCSVKYAKQ